MLQLKRKTNLFILLGLTIIVILAGFLFWWQKPSQPALQPSPQQSSPTPTPTSTPTSQPTSSDRAETFIISGSEEFPHFTKELKINPFYDAKIEETLSFSIWAEDPEGIEKVTATIITEKGEKKINLQLTEGTKKKGKWQGKWKIEDVSSGTSPDIIFKAENTKGKKTQLSTYFHIQAEQAEEESFLRKIFSFFKTKEALAAVQCPLPASGNTTISSNCYIPQNTEVGVEGGNLTIRATITMERNSTLIFNPGKSIIMGPGGYILKSVSNTIITKGHVTVCVSHDHKSCYDNDLYWYDSCGNIEEKYQECGSSDCDSWSSNYCVGDDVYHQRICYDKGCSEGSCYSDSYTETQLVEHCSAGQICQNGECVTPSGCEDWARRSPSVMCRGPFDAIVGSSPVTFSLWVRNDDLAECDPSNFIAYLRYCPEGFSCSLTPSTSFVLAPSETYKDIRVVVEKVGTPPDNPPGSHFRYFSVEAVNLDSGLDDYTVCNFVFQ